MPELKVNCSIIGTKIYVTQEGKVSDLASLDLPQKGLTETLIKLVRYQLHNGGEEDQILLSEMSHDLNRYFDPQS